jgi:hypothetical protein
VRLAIDLQEDILHDIFGLCFIVQNADGDAVHEPRVAAKEHGQRLAIRFVQCGDERRILVRATGRAAAGLRTAAHRAALAITCIDGVSVMQTTTIDGSSRRDGAVHNGVCPAENRALENLSRGRRFSVRSGRNSVVCVSSASCRRRSSQSLPA